MSLDPTPSTAELLRMKAEREGRRHGTWSTQQIAPIKAAIAWPVRLTIPWSLLVSDNDKYGVIDGRMLVTSRYRQAKAAIAALARTLLGSVEPVALPTSIESLVWLPDNRIHDVCNFSKCVHDALEGVVYVKDCWLHDIHWRRAGVDVDAPRAELTLTPSGP